MGLPTDQVGKVKTEPWQGIKGVAKAQWMVAPKALGAAVAAPSVYKAGAEAAAKAAAKPGATADTVKAAKQAAKDAAKLAAEHSGKGMVAKGIGHLIPGIGSAVAAYSAIDNFRNGHIVAGALDVVGMIPGPIGWVAMGAAWAWKTWGENGIGQWDAPDGKEVHMLPSSAKDESGVTTLDAVLREAQGKVFSFQDGPQGSVWNSNSPKALRLDTSDVRTALDAWITGITGLFAEMDKTMQQSGESYFQQQRQALQPHFKAMSDLKTVSSDIMAQLKAASGGGEEAYKAVTGANADVRKQLADDGKLSDQASAITATALLEKGAAKIDEAETKLGQIAANTAATEVPVTGGTTNAPGYREAPKAPEKPVTTNPAPSIPQPSTTPQAPKQETPKNDDTISKLLSQLGQQTPKATTPTTPSVPTSNLGSSGLGGNQGGGTPLSQSKPETKKEEEPKKLVDDKPKSERKKEDVKPLTESKPENEKAQVKPEAKPQAAPAAAPVAAAAAPAGTPTPAAQNAAHAAKADEKPNTEVDVKGAKATFPDPKTAKMAEILSRADATHPMSLADAAKAAGLVPPVPGQDPGQQIPPSDAKPGDVMVAGEKKFMLLGDGKFYDLTDYKVVGADELPKDMGDRAGYFRLADANPGAPAGTQPGPVSPQSQTAPAMPVANPTGAQPGPVAGNPPPAPGMPPAAPGSVPSVGSPGVPKAGAPGSGPGNASATDSGTGVGGPSTAGGQRLDPGVIR